MNSRYGICINPDGTDWLCDLVNASQDCVIAGCNAETDDYEMMLRKLETETNLWLADSTNHRLVMAIARGVNLDDMHLCGFAGCLHCVRNLVTFFDGASFVDVRDALNSALERSRLDA